MFPPLEFRRRIASGVARACVAISFLGSAPLLADPSNTAANVPPTQATSLSWIGPNGKAYVLQAISPPPAPSSDQEKSDLQAVLKAQSERTAADVQEAMADQNFTIALFGDVLGPDFTPQNYPVTFDFLNHVLMDENFLNAQLQKRYKRRPPYADHPEVKNLFAATGASSYPSQFAAQARIIMLVLAELFPEKASAIVTRELVLTQSGVNAGVSYPSDVNAGKAQAHALIYVLQDNPGFDKDMAGAKAEILSKATAAKTQK
jgi:acid phosphatase (class A)